MYKCVTERDVILLVAEEIYGKASQPLNSGLFKKSLVSSTHISKIIGLLLMKLSSKTLQNLPYYWNKKT